MTPAASASPPRTRSAWHGERGLGALPAEGAYCPACLRRVPVGATEPRLHREACASDPLAVWLHHSPACGTALAAEVAGIPDTDAGAWGARPLHTRGAASGRSAPFVLTGHLNPIHHANAHPGRPLLRIIGTPMTHLAHLAQRALLPLAASFAAGLAAGLAREWLSDYLTSRAAADLTVLLRTRER